jgi:hypothetical protein
MRTFEVEADPRGRLSLGRAGVTPGKRYQVEAWEDGSMTLSPVTSVPDRELETLRDPETVLKVQEGVRQAGAGETVDLGDFTQYT